jgi:hypothetical protein
VTAPHFGSQAVHGLRDAQLTLNRAQLEAMPGEWQARFAALLDELDTIPELTGDVSCPALEGAFTVRSGLALVRGLNLSLVFPEGACWPGLGALPAAWREDLAAQEIVLTPGTRCDASMVDVVAGRAQVQVQLLSRGTATGRLRVLAELTPPEALRRDHLGDIIDYTHRTARRVLKDGLRSLP